jgi:UDP-N-acetylmuramate--alanine ligase
MVTGTDGTPPTLVANVGDPGAARVVGRLGDWPGRVVRVALDGVADIHGRLTAGEVGRGRLVVEGLSGGSLEAALALPGRHNAANALVVAAAADVLGVPGQKIAAGLASFPGVGRRLELKGEPRGVAVLDDYAHHPTAIAATIEAVRARYPGRRLWAVYEPLTYHRTAAMLDAFAGALAGADRAVVADIWAGRDPDTTIASAERLASAVAERRPEIPVGAPGSVEATADWLASEVRPGDAVLVMGGGRSNRIGERLLELLGR